MKPTFYFSIFLLSQVCFLYGKITAQSPGWDWAKGIGGGGGFVESNSIVGDPNGSIYITGQFSDTIDFDPGMDTFNLIAVEAHNLFVLKLDNTGNFLWAKSMSGTGNSSGNSIAIDAARGGGVYTTGFFTGTVDFDPGVGTYYLTSAPHTNNSFISKLDSLGNFIWAKSFAGGSNISNSITIDPINGSVYTTGQFSGTVDFDPGSGIMNLTASNVSGFISRLDDAGNFVWAKMLTGGNSGYLDSKSLVVDPSGNGNVYTTGDYTGTIDFDPGNGTFDLTSLGGTDIFVSKLDGSGNLVWAKSMGGTANEWSYSIGISLAGNGGIYTTGTYHASGDYDPGPGVFNLPLSGAFISRLNLSGEFVWAKSFTNGFGCRGNTISIDPITGNAFTAGSFGGTIDFDPGPGTFNLTSIGYSDTYFSKLDSSGNFEWAKSFGVVNQNQNSEPSTFFDSTGDGNIYSTGVFKETVDFDPGPGTFNLTTAGVQDIFISKLDDEGIFDWALSIEGKIPGRVYSSDIVVDDARDGVYTTGYFKGTVDFNPGQDTYYLTSEVIDINSGGTMFISKLDKTGNFEWVLPMVVADEYSYSKGHSISVDASNGSIYTTGLFRGTVDFDPGPGIFNLTSFGYYENMFISKLDSSGNFIWAKQIYSEFNGGCVGNALSIDDSGNIYITGHFAVYADFDPGPSTYYQWAEYKGGFIAKYDGSCNFIWANAITEGFAYYGEATGQSIQVESGTGNVYVTGYFMGYCVWGNFVWDNEIDSEKDVFISKLDSLGQFVWTQIINGEGQDDYAIDLEIDIIRGGSIYITGYFHGTIDIIGQLSILTSNGGSDIFVVKLDSLGGFIWAKGAGGIYDDAGTSIVLDHTSGNIYISGNFYGEVDFDPGPNTFNLNEIPGSFILGLTYSGHFLWAESLGPTFFPSNPPIDYWIPDFPTWLPGSPYWPAGSFLDIGENRNIFVSGTYDHPTILFDGTSLSNIGTYGSEDVYVAKIEGCSNIVTSTADNGFGTLRDVISCVASSSTVTFDLEPMSQITLTSGEIIIDKNLNISGPGIFDLTISGNNASRIFHLFPGHDFTLRDLALKNASSATNGGAIFVRGNLNLENIRLQNNFQNGIPKSMTINPGVEVNMIGVVEIKN